MGKSKVIGLCAAVLAVAVVYQNCSPVHSGGANESSFSGGCDSAQYEAFVSTYYTQVMTSTDTNHNCLPCHAEGGAAGAGRWFAQADSVAAFNVFQSVGRAAVEGNMVNAGHQPPHTGPQNQTYIDNAKAIWTAADKTAAACSGSTTLTTADVTLPAAIYTSAPADSVTWPKIKWDLDTQMADSSLDATYHFTIEMEVRVYNNIGYQFRNPIVTVKTTNGTTPTYKITGITMNLNDTAFNTMTTYSLLTATVNSTTGTNIAAGTAVALAITPTMTVANTDQLSLNFASITDGTGQPITTGTTTTTTTTSSLPTRVSFADLQSTNAVTGVFQRSCDSCHNSSNMQDGLDLTNYNAAASNASLIQSRMNKANNPMPPSGLLSNDDRSIIDIWVSSGVPQQ